MMDNKCKPANNKYLDHVYCHSSESKNYIRANSTGNSASPDVMALIKENKQLKAMLILHLDLIQEQSDQLMAKDKLLATLREDNEALKLKTERLERQLQTQQELHRQQSSAKRSASGSSIGILSLPPPPLAKIQCKHDEHHLPSSKVEDVQLEKVDRKTISNAPTSDDTAPIKRNYKIQESPVKASKHGGHSKGTSIIGECNGQFISKIILHRINVPGMSPSSGSESASEIDENILAAIQEDDLNEDEDDEDNNDFDSEEPKSAVTVARKVKERRITAVNIDGDSQDTEKQIKIDSDGSMSCDSITERDQLPSPRGAGKPHQINYNTPHLHKHHQQPPHKTRRCGYLTTSQMYCTREWEDVDFCDEFIKEEAKALQADAPMLEIPKWTVHDYSASYCIEGTEDLSDDTFLKRHAKLEHDEKRRKKWDVQQIREQRRIEKLKRRHCKDEVREATANHNAVLSFYPQPDTIQTICYVSDLPVHAFGEGIPRISMNADFTLPWHQQSGEIDTTRAGSRSCSTQNQQQKSTFVFLKKRRRQQSSSVSQARSRIPAARAPAQHSAIQPPLPPTALVPSSTVENTNNE